MHYDSSDEYCPPKGIPSSSAQVSNPDTLFRNSFSADINPYATEGSLAWRRQVVLVLRGAAIVNLLSKQRKTTDDS